MKTLKYMLPIALSSLFIATGCNANTNSQNEREQVADELQPTNRQDPTKTETDHKLGYVRYQKDQLDGQSEKQHYIHLDRSKMADTIARMILRGDQFAEVATLITDREALIAYQLNDDIDQKTGADIASKIAQSVLPGFFDVYTSDNKSLMNDIQSLHNSSTNRNYDNTVKHIIDEMKKSSQTNDTNSHHVSK